MNLNITTLAIIQASMLIIEVFILWFQFKSAPRHIGVRLWLTGTLFMAAGVIFMPLVKIPSLLFLAIIANPLYIMGLLLLYQGTVFFMGGRSRICLIPIIFTLFLLLYYYFLLIFKTIMIRNLIVNLTYFSIFVLIAITIFKNKKPHYHNSSLFTGAVFIIAALFSLLRIFVSINLSLNVDYLGLGLTLPLAFLILWHYEYFVDLWLHSYPLWPY